MGTKAEHVVIYRVYEPFNGAPMLGAVEARVTPNGYHCVTASAAWRFRQRIDKMEASTSPLAAWSAYVSRVKESIRGAEMELERLRKFLAFAEVQVGGGVQEAGCDVAATPNGQP